ncbi:MAG: energy-coupling factor ABC transporter ATP-binding protein [Halanaeroarchaeum sp.]
MIDLSDVAYAYEDGPRVLRGVDLHVDRGETVALMGPNGAGKTTLLKLVAGLYEPRAGTVRVAETPVGFAPEDPDDALFAESVAAEVGFFPDNLGLDVEARVEEALAAVDATALRDRAPQSLAVGEKRRISLAAVLAGEPAVVALDEPTSGLDRGHAAALGEVLRELERTVVMATHDADFAYRYADRVAIVRAGRIDTRGETRALLGDPSFDFDRVGIRPPGPVQFARRMGWSQPPRSVAAAVAKMDETGETF